ncbi:hypothetical protein [Treponema saccharophilum]|uniref:hypothetical protein n=1 Tax=Treponema saccharophilum TaxID=165 RepID=UPI003870BC78
MKKTASGKIARMALIGGAFSLLLSFGLVSCSDSSDDDSSSSQNQETPQNNQPEEQKVSVTSVWNFKEGANASANATLVGYGSTATKPTSVITIDADSGSGATLKLLVQTGCSVKYSTGLQWGASSKETDVMKITADEACTLEVVGKGSSGNTFSTSKPNSFSVNGTSVYARASADETSEQTWTVSLNKGDNTIAVSGMKFISFTCK